jgi:hypothetical protein
MKKIHMLFSLTMPAILLCWGSQLQANSEVHQDNPQVTV